jgi:hypothetical protein
LTLSQTPGPNSRNRLQLSSISQQHIALSAHKAHGRQPADLVTRYAPYAEAKISEDTLAGSRNCHGFAVHRFLSLVTPSSGRRFGLIFEVSMFIQSRHEAGSDFNSTNSRYGLVGSTLRKTC